MVLHLQVLQHLKEAPLQLLRHKQGNRLRRQQLRQARRLARPLAARPSMAPHPPQQPRHRNQEVRLALFQVALQVLLQPMLLERQPQLQVSNPALQRAQRPLAARLRQVQPLKLQSQAVKEPHSRPLQRKRGNRLQPQLQRQDKPLLLLALQRQPMVPRPLQQRRRRPSVHLALFKVALLVRPQRLLGPHRFLLQANKREPQRAQRPLVARPLQVQPPKFQVPVVKAPPHRLRQRKLDNPPTPQLLQHNPALPLA